MNLSTRKLLGVLVFAVGLTLAVTVGLTLAVASCGWTVAREDEVKTPQRELICFQNGKQVLQIVASGIEHNKGSINVTKVQGVGVDVEVHPGATTLCAIVDGKLPPPKAPTPTEPAQVMSDAGPTN